MMVSLQECQGDGQSTSGETLLRYAEVGDRYMVDDPEETQLQ